MSRFILKTTSQQYRSFGVAIKRMSSSYLIEDPKYSFLKELGLGKHNSGVFDGKWEASGPVVKSINPSNGRVIAEVATGNVSDYERVAKASEAAWHAWSEMPAPQRGEIVRQVGDALRDKLQPLGKLLALEMGKILPEALGEVIEFIHVCDLALGLSRSLPGQLLPSERAGHVLMEKWNPLGVVGIISAFNFPVAVYGWNAAIALVCGDATLWKPSETTPLVSVAVTRILEEVLKKNNVNGAIASLCTGGADVGKALVADNRVKLVSFTGSTAVGREVGVEVQKRFGRHILELGGNNAIIVNDDANIDLFISSAVFACAGTAGQRCTTTRRIFLHEKIYDTTLERLKTTFAKITTRIGDPLDEKSLIGPLHTPAAIEKYEKTLQEVLKHGGKIEFGGKRIEREGNFVEPTIVTGLDHASPLVQSECFAPIVYIFKVSNFETAVKLNNDVPQGLSSSVFTENLSNVFTWIGPHGSDCGIVNINAPTNGAEVGGAFGGEKATGGGRECGSDAWKAYMRRATVTLNHRGKIEFAQNVNFSLE